MSWAVKVSREKLLEKIVANRTSHRETVTRALDRYREAVVKELDKMVEKAKKGRDIDTIIRLPRPEDHTSDYDTIIGMLQLSQEEFVSLGPTEYRSYYQDKWDWSERFAVSNAAYGIR